MTNEEKALWNKLRENKLAGLRFKPQHPIHIFIADFYCHKAKLVIEIDGSSHENLVQKQYDAERTSQLKSFGIKVLRFKNSEVKNHLDHVLSHIEKIALELIEFHQTSTNQSSTPALKGGIESGKVPNSPLQGVGGKHQDSTNQSSTPALKGGIGAKNIPNSPFQEVWGKKTGVR